MKCHKEDAPLLGLMGQSMRLIGKRAQELYAEYDLNRAQSGILFALHQEDSMSQKELAKRLNVTPPSITYAELFSDMGSTPIASTRKNRLETQVSGRFSYVQNPHCNPPGHNLLFRIRKDLIQNTFQLFGCPLLLPFYQVGIDAVSIHLTGMSDQRFHRAFRQSLGHRDESMP